MSTVDVSVAQKNKLRFASYLLVTQLLFSIPSVYGEIPIGARPQGGIIPGGAAGTGAVDSSGGFQETSIRDLMSQLRETGLSESEALALLNSRGIDGGGNGVGGGFGSGLGSELGGSTLLKDPNEALADLIRGVIEERQNDRNRRAPAPLSSNGGGGGGGGGDGDGGGNDNDRRRPSPLEAFAALAQAGAGLGGAAFDASARKAEAKEDAKAAKEQAKYQAMANNFAALQNKSAAVGQNQIAAQMARDAQNAQSAQEAMKLADRGADRREKMRQDDRQFREEMDLKRQKMWQEATANNQSLINQRLQFAATMAAAGFSGAQTQVVTRPNGAGFAMPPPAGTVSNPYNQPIQPIAGLRLPPPRIPVHVPVVFRRLPAERVLRPARSGPSGMREIAAETSPLTLIEGSTSKDKVRLALMSKREIRRSDRALAKALPVQALLH